MFMDFCNTLELSRTTTRSWSLSPLVQTVDFLSFPTLQCASDRGSEPVCYIRAVCRPHRLNVNHNASHTEAVVITALQCIIGAINLSIKMQSPQLFHMSIIHTSLLIIMQLIYDAEQSATCGFFLALRAPWHVHFAEQQCGLALWPDC